MRVLLVGRPEGAINAGGDRIQLIKTCEYLNKIGVHAAYTFNPMVKLSGYDLIHLFTLNTWEAYRRVRQASVPYVLTPIYWDATEMMTEFMKQRAQSFSLYHLLGHNQVFLRLLNRLLPIKKFIGLLAQKPFYWKSALTSARQYGRNRLLREKENKQEIIENAEVLLPNAESEMQCLNRNYKSNKDYCVIPNAASKEYYHVNRKEYINPLSGISDFVLCVAALYSFRKNQLSLIKALKNDNISLVLVGGTRTRVDKKYLELCRRESNKNIRFLPKVRNSDLGALYSWAKVHVLPSWYETPGLVSLEAGLSGCNVVSTNRGSAWDYFGNRAWYCSPNSLDSIRNAVLAALYSDRKTELKDEIYEKFIWEVTAQKTKEVYKCIC